MPSHAKSLLIIEDDELNRETLCSLLGEEYNMIEADNGQKGMRILQEQYEKISAVLLDMSVSELDGYQILEHKLNDKHLCNIPVLVLADSLNPEEEERCLTLGVSDIIPKPYNRSILRKRVKNIVRLRESSDILSIMEIDPETGIFTRSAFLHYAGKKLRENPETKYSVAISDIDGYHGIIEKYGEKMAQEVLKRNVQLMFDNTPEGGIFGRYGNDELVSFFPVVEEETVEESKERAKGLEVSVDGEVMTSVKVSVCECEDPNVPISIYLARASAALRFIKHRYGVNLILVDNKLKEQMHRRNVLEEDMRTALTTDQFKVFYQPKHNAETGELVGAEALIRWQHPLYGFLPPYEFITLFENTGFICEADQYVWEQTCKNLRKWQDKGLNVVPVSVNCSRLEFFDTNDFFAKRKQALDQYHIDPYLLHIEITETMLETNEKEMLSVLDHCRNCHIGIDLDDFGAGFSSLNSLVELPLNVVKLDMSLVRQIGDKRKEQILRGCIGMIKNLGYDIVAEGVETQDQLDIIREMGADTIQGYFFSRPLSEEDFEAYLQK